MPDNGDNGGDTSQLPEVYPQLRAIARSFLSRERKGHTLQPTALVHEALLRIPPGKLDRDVDRRELVGIAARTMRMVLVDHARRRNAQKRGGTAERTPLDDALAVYEERALDVLALNEALERLAKLDTRVTHIIELRFFAGLTEAETAEALEIAPSTVRREWRLARNWLYHVLREGEEK